MANKFLKRLLDMEGAVKQTDYDPLMNCMRSPSPGVNWAFATPGHGVPYGFGTILWGPPKAGKSILANAMIGQMHKDDPEAMAISFNTELRGELQANNSSAHLWGIDPERHITFDVNQPEHIFDRIRIDIDAMCQEGAKIKCIVIDSLTGIGGRRAGNAESINTQQIGDQAATIKDGLMWILPTIRKYKIALIATAHVRAELNRLEQMRGHDTKMAAAWATKHTFEFFCYVEKNQNKKGKTDLAGNEFKNDAIVDFKDNAENTGHKILFKVTDNSVGPSGRSAEFTIDYNKGFINTHEEVFQLGLNTGVIERPSNSIYKFGTETYKGLPAILPAIRDNEALYNEILRQVYAKDTEPYMARSMGTK